MTAIVEQIGKPIDSSPVQLTNFIGGKWVKATTPSYLDVPNPGH